MNTTVKSTKQGEMPKIFTSTKIGQIVNRMEVQHLQLDDIVIPEENKQIVRERIKKYENSPGNYLSWNDIERKMAARK